jgi:hypothetical protein
MNKLTEYGVNVGVATLHFAGSFVRLYRPRPTESYGLNIAISLDEFGNAITGGDPGETISSRAGKARAQGQKWACVLCKVLAWITATNHCAESVEANEGSKAVIPD